MDKNWQKKNQTITNLRHKITDAIDKICKESNYNITYAEINTALVEVLKNNLNYELRDEEKS